MLAALPQQSFQSMNTAALADAVACLEKENARLRREHLMQQRSILLQEQAQLQALAGYPLWPGISAPPGLEVDVKPPGFWCSSSLATPSDCSFASSQVSFMSSTTSSAALSDSDHDVADAPGKTTVMIRNLPNNFSSAELLDLLSKHGFTGRYNFVYLPIDFNTSVGFGYAFVNFLCQGDAELCLEELKGYREWQVGSDKVLEVVWSTTNQGLLSHIERYRNSPVMHDSVDDAFKPLLLEDGQRVPFPRPTKKLKAPQAATRRQMKL